MGRDGGADAPAAKPKRKKGPVRFVAEEPARSFPCAMCERDGRRGRRGGPRMATSWHHWLAQQHIRVWARSLPRYLPEKERRGILRKRLRDRRNIVPLCDLCHFGLEYEPGDAHKFFAEDVPAAALEFARELGAEWEERLRRSYVARGKRT